MMDFDINNILYKKEGIDLEFKAVLPPSKNLAQLICAFANTQGGHIVLGVKESLDPQPNEIIGLSSDFNVNTIVKKAIGMVVPQAKVEYGYSQYQNKTIYIIKIEKSDKTITLENVLYKRENDKVIGNKQSIQEVKVNNVLNVELKKLLIELQTNKQKATSSRVAFIKHYQSMINVLNKIFTDTFDPREQEILLRILFSSCADNFETYLSDLLFEIYLAKPSTLKSEEQITVKEVLNCSDLDDFIVMFARKKISKLQRGSVKAFIEDNKQISALGVINDSEQDVEKILQIRHLYSHRNGIVDEKFQKYFPDSILGKLYNLTIIQIAEKLNTLVDTVNRVDNAAIDKYGLSTYVE